MQQPSEPIFNIPAVVVAVLAALAAIHGARELVLGILSAADREVLELFAFIPKRYETNVFGLETYAGGLGAEIWTFVTYALLHADVTHLVMNVFWLVPFGSAVARRFGPMRFLAFFAATAAAGAVVHLATHAGEGFPLIGASAAVSGMMAASARFAFQPGGPLAEWQKRSVRSWQIPAVPLLSALRDPRIIGFLAVWFGLNILFGLGSLPIVGEGQRVAWEAHMGGFLAGLFLFSVFDPVPNQVSSGDSAGPENQIPGE